jgi:hypothetical protein
MFSLDYASAQPVYRQIVEQVLQRIKTGALRPGDRLPRSGSSHSSFRSRAGRSSGPTASSRTTT